MEVNIDGFAEFLLFRSIGWHLLVEKYDVEALSFTYGDALESLAEAKP